MRKKVKTTINYSYYTTDELTEFIAKHLFERSHFYDQAKIQVSIDNKS